MRIHTHTHTHKHKHARTLSLSLSLSFSLSLSHTHTHTHTNTHTHTHTHTHHSDKRGEVVKMGSELWSRLNGVGAEGEGVTRNVTALRDDLTADPVVVVLRFVARVLHLCCTCVLQCRVLRCSGSVLATT